MRRMLALLAAAGVLIWAQGSSLGEEGLVEKVVAAHGGAEAFGPGKTFALDGVLKSYHGGGLAKYDMTLKIRFPKDRRLTLQGKDGTFDSSGDLVLGDRGWSYHREAFRPMAADEVAGIHAAIRDYDWVGRLKRGELKGDPVADKTFEDVECAGIRLVEENGDQVTLYFAKETWLLHRREETSTDPRDGSTSERAVQFEEYEEHGGVQIPMIRTMYVNSRIENTKEEKYKLAQKVEVYEVSFEPAFEASDFAVPQDPFDVSGLSAEAAKARAGELLKFFEGRRDPSQAGWACEALARLQAADAAATLTASDNKELAFYGNLARVRMGQGNGMPKELSATEWKKEVDRAMGYPAGAAKLGVRYVGSAGVRVDAKGASVFINAFYQPQLFNTASPGLDPRSVVKADVLLFTHGHRDHFDPWIVADILKRTDAKVAGPSRVTDMLRAHGVSDDRLVTLAPEEGKPAKATFGAVLVEAHAVAHGSETTEKGKVQHVAFVVRIGDVKIVHFGEAKDSKGMDEEAAKAPDVVFLPHWMLNFKNEEALKQLGIRYIVPTCFPDTPGTYGSMTNLRDVNKRVVAMLPGQEVQF